MGVHGAHAVAQIGGVLGHIVGADVVRTHIVAGVLAKGGSLGVLAFGDPQLVELLLAPLVDHVVDALIGQLLDLFNVGDPADQLVIAILVLDFLAHFTRSSFQMP